MYIWLPLNQGESINLDNIKDTDVIRLPQCSVNEHLFDTI